MFGMTVKTEDLSSNVLVREQKARFENFRHTAAGISKDSKESIDKSKDSSPEGSPPHTRGRGGHNLKGAIRFDVSLTDAVIGPMFSYVGTAGEAHEFGGTYKGVDFPERRFMAPALDRNLHRFHQGWAGSI